MSNFPLNDREFDESVSKQIKGDGGEGFGGYFFEVCCAFMKMAVCLPIFKVTCHFGFCSSVNLCHRF
jgi:hypothetical protein